MSKDDLDQELNKVMLFYNEVFRKLTAPIIEQPDNLEFIWNTKDLHTDYPYIEPSQRQFILNELVYKRFHEKDKNIYFFEYNTFEKKHRIFRLKNDQLEMCVDCETMLNTHGDEWKDEYINGQWENIANVIRNNINKINEMKRYPMDEMMEIEQQQKAHYASLKYTVKNLDELLERKMNENVHLT